VQGGTSQWGPSGNVLLSSYMKVWHSNEFASYPGNISANEYPPSSGVCTGIAINISRTCKWKPDSTAIPPIQRTNSTCITEPGCTWIPNVQPFGISTLHNVSLLSNQTFNGSASHTFSFDLNQSGLYNISCGGYYLVVNDTSIYNKTGKIYDIYSWQTVWVEPTGGGIVNAGKGLVGNISSSALWFVVLILDMTISSFFVVKFGMRSAFVFLIIWGMALTIFGGWGFTVQTGTFAVGFLLWIALMFYPYRRE